MKKEIAVVLVFPSKRARTRSIYPGRHDRANRVADESDDARSLRYRPVTEIARELDWRGEGVMPLGIARLIKS